jgi:hypothetical protein
MRIPRLWPSTELNIQSEQVGSYDGGQRPNLISGFPPRRVWPIRCARNEARKHQ